MKYAQIDTHRRDAPVTWLCSAVNVSSRSYYEWRSRDECARRRVDRKLLTEIRASHAQSHGTYGSPRITKDLHALGYRVSSKRVARLMRENGLEAVGRRKFKRTTNAAHTFPVTPNLVDRCFNVDTRNRVWVADITHIRTEQGWLYLAALMDLYSRRVVGWNTAARIDRHLVVTALERALRKRNPEPGLIHHSDRGSQYASYEYQARLSQSKVISSMSRKGDCYDNAAMESFFSSLKRERVHRRRYWSRGEATDDIKNYIEVFYNGRRRHSHLGGISPIDYENQPSELN